MKIVKMTSLNNKNTVIDRNIKYSGQIEIQSNAILDMNYI